MPRRRLPLMEAPPRLAQRSSTPPRWHDFEPVPLDPILESSLAAFTEFGYHGSSVRDIANRVGVTVPTLYYHYQSKQGLMLALLQASSQDLISRTGHALNEAGPHPLHRFVDLVDCTVRFMCHRRRLARLDAESRYLDEGARAIYAAPRKQVERQFLDVLQHGVETGTFRVDHPVDVNRALLGTFQSIAMWYRKDGELSPSDIAARYLEFSLDAVRTNEWDRTAGLTRSADAAS